MGNTYFFNSAHQILGELNGILPIALYKGMKITIHGNSKTFFVDSWDYHHGHPDEQAGLRIHLTT